MAKRQLEEISAGAGIVTGNGSLEKDPSPKRVRTASTSQESKPRTRHKASSQEAMVKEINSLDTAIFTSRYIDASLLRPVTKDDQTFNISFVQADHLTPGEHNATFALVEQTSRHDYESNGDGWHPLRKRREMLDPDMRYLLLRCSSNPAPVLETHGKDVIVDTSICGYASFMVTHDSTPSVPVIYLYEIHLAKEARGVGMGGRLTEVVESVAEKIGVELVMLTCFLSNRKAHGFYKRRGFGRDVSSPGDRRTRGRVLKCKYEIMSKSVGGKTAANQGLKT